jgi:hypothetical protein
MMEDFMNRTVIYGLFASVFFFSTFTFAADFKIRVENISMKGAVSTSEGDKVALLSPGAWALHTGQNPIYKEGELASPALERLAEDGNPEGLVSYLQLSPNVKDVGYFNVSVSGNLTAGPIGPMQAYEFIVRNAVAGDKLSLATMFVESNDWFYSNSSSINLFNYDGTPFSGDVSAKFALYDAGTEHNQEPGLGSDQAPRQPRTDTGTPTRINIYPINSTTTTWEFPSTKSVIKVTVTPK